MQLISTLLLLFSLVLFVGAILFVAKWYSLYRRVPFMHMLREDIGHIGVSAVVEYPKTLAPLVALLEEEYPHNEAVVIADLQGINAQLREAVERYCLVKVNHTHLEGVRALYRSHHRAFRRVVVVDLPIEHRARVATIGREVATYDNILYLQGESIVERNALTYCANVVASQSSADVLLLRSIVGTDARLERGDIERSDRVLHLRSDCPLAWRRCTVPCALLAVLVPSVGVLVAHLFESWQMLASAILITGIISIFLYLSCCVVTEKSLFARLDTVLQNCYRFFVNKRPTIRESRTRDNSPYPSRVQVQNRPVRYRGGVRPER